MSKSKTYKKKQHKKQSHTNQSRTNQSRTNQSPTTKKPERGWLLTGAIILVGISGLISLFTIFAEKGFDASAIPAWFIAAAGAAAIADIVAAFGLWGWKKWAYYLYLGATLVSVVLGLLATGSLLFAFSRIIPFAIVGYIILPKWKYFD